MSLKTFEEYNHYVRQYADSLEMKYLRRKTLYISVIFSMLTIPIVLALYNYGFPFGHIGIYVLSVLMLVFINLAFFKYDNIFMDIKLGIKVTTLGIYLLSMSLIVDIQSPSIFAILFVVYALVSIYQDRTTTILNNILLFLIGSVIIIFYPNIIQTIDIDNTQVFYVYLFIAIFVALLSLAFSILIKRKQYFYYQIAKIKEDEVRNIQLLIELKANYKRSDYNFSQYYDLISDFTDEFCKRRGIKNPFQERLLIINRLHDVDVDKFNNYSSELLDSIKRLSQLILKENSKIHHLILKASENAVNNNENKPIKLFNQFSSFKHVYDEKYIKILTFAVFYTSLKMPKIYLDKLSGEEILHTIKNHDFKHLFDADILDVYLDNWNLIDKMVEDELSKLVKT